MPVIGRCWRGARAESPTVVMSLFVNPTQFGEGAVLAAYPRDEAADGALAREAGVDLALRPGAGGDVPAGVPRRSADAAV